jgi:hypothetical protein
MKVLEEDLLENELASAWLESYGLLRFSGIILIPLTISPYPI